jgi:hypothetical protein
MLIEKSSSFSSLIFPRESENWDDEKVVLFYFSTNFFVVNVLVHKNAQLLFALGQEQHLECFAF